MMSFIVYTNVISSILLEIVFKENNKYLLIFLFFGTILPIFVSVVYQFDGMINKCVPNSSTYIWFGTYEL